MRPVPVEIICYHCQQASEKYLKAVIALQGIEPPYTHDLNELCKQCENYIPSFAVILPQCAAITFFGVQPRYDFMMNITENDLKRVLRDTDTVRKHIEKEVPQLFQSTANP
jgi:HEPN domain-containing protein